jgi:hypothetical protein
MATWNVIDGGGNEQNVEAHNATCHDGALVFSDNNLDCAKLILAPGSWHSCILIKPNPNSYFD